MHLRIIFLCCIFLHPGFSTVFAQYNQYQFSRLDINDGLPHNQINCIHKDNKGFVWFGTMAGLARYDGYTFKIYQHSSRDTNSINDNDIRSIMEAPDNKLWIETRAGIDSYDPETESFSHNLRYELSSYSIPESTIRSVKKDHTGIFWFISGNTGVYSYNPVSKKVIYFRHVVKQQVTPLASPVIDLAEGRSGEIWLIHSDGMLEQLDRTRNRVLRRISSLSRLFNKENDTFRLFIDRQGFIWIYDLLSSKGIFYIDPVSKTLKNISRNSSSPKLNSDIVTGVMQDNAGDIWIGTDHGGINLLDKKDFTIRYLLNNEDNNKSLSQNNISAVYYDRSGMAWVGTFRRGINYYHPGIIKFGLIKHSSNNPNSLVYNDINRLAEDGDGNIWIGTNGKGLVYYNRKSQQYRVYTHQSARPGSLSHDAVVALYFDKSGKLWVGTYSGGLDYFDGKTFTHFRNSSADPLSLSDNRVSDIIEDSSGRFWVATMGGGLNLFDRKSHKFRRITEQGRRINSNYIFKVIEDSRKNIWLATGFGINILPRGSNRFISLLHDPVKANSLINNNMNTIAEDSRGYIWCGTRDGLSIYDPRKKAFHNFSTEDGLPDNNILDIQEDGNHNFWLSTSNGLSKAAISYGDKLRLAFKNFDENDGLQGKEFNRNASLKLRSGELLFGGSDGLNIFNPALIKTYNIRSRLLLTDFQLFNKSLSVNKPVDGAVILTRPIYETSHISLNHDQNVFTIEFASLNYVEPHKVKHQYMMQGFDKSWISSDNAIRKATYTNLDPGNYIFKVRASDTDGIWQADPVELHIEILPPFYKSLPAYLLYVLAVTGLLFYIRNRGIQKLKRQFEAEQERKEIKRLIEEEKLEAQRVIEQERMEVMRYRELDAMKIKFLTNVSHEFRTPLSLILAPIDKILKLYTDPGLHEQVSLIRRNARRLLHLVNQLLDFRKMELKELKLQKRPGNIVKFLKEITWSFKDIAEQKNIQLSFNAMYEDYRMSFDHDKVERILFNLLSNAFKFTFGNGKVNVSVDILREKNILEIKVRDTGIGIPKDKQEKIFDSFFQNDIPDSIINQGSGIGLSITREFAELHGGEISLESESSFGSCFTVHLPADELSLTEDAESFVEEILTKEEVTSGLKKVTEIPGSSKKPTVLIVEDDIDFRFYLKDNLKEDFNVIEAGNGKDGWQKTLFYHPAIIVSDISMPEMNGTDLCRKIKNDARTLHIPVVLLTAITGEEQQIKGLETGANDYITKPFSFEILNSRIKNILAQQESARKTYQKQVEVHPVEVESESPDEKFIQDTLQIIEKNIANTNFSVDELSSLLLISRVTLYKRIVSLTGKTPLEFIKSYRLKRAAQLLEKGSLTVSQVCYKVGFKTPKHFVKSFKAEFDVIPSKYAEHKND